MNDQLIRLPHGQLPCHSHVKVNLQLTVLHCLCERSCLFTVNEVQEANL